MPADGRVFEGEWRDGVPYNGRGLWWDGHNHVYDGDWGMLEGKGKIVICPVTEDNPNGTKEMAQPSPLYLARVISLDRAEGQDRHVTMTPSGHETPFVDSAALCRRPLKCRRPVPSPSLKTFFQGVRMFVPRGCVGADPGRDGGRGFRGQVAGRAAAGRGRVRPATVGRAIEIRAVGLQLLGGGAAQLVGRPGRVLLRGPVEGRHAAQ